MSYRFAEFELDTERMEFFTGGAVRTPEPEVLDLLRHLVANPERLVSRDELIEAVWDERIVLDATVSARINAARRALGDSGARQASIKTGPRRGFRFVAPVEVADGARAGEKRERSSATAQGEAARAAAIPDKPFILVLPFS